MSNAQGNGDEYSSNAIVITVWLLAAVVFLLAPCLISRYQRELWWKRLRSCSWNVEVEPEPEAAWFRVARERYAAQQFAARQAALARNLISDAGDEIRHLFLLERMAGFTITLKSEDILSKEGAETSEHRNTQEILREEPSQSPNTDSHVGLHCPEGRADSSLATGCEDVTRQDLPQVQEIYVGKGMILEAVIGEDIERGSNDGNLDDDMCLVGESWVEESSTLVCVPVPGMPVTAECKYRYVPNGCAICLCHFDGGDRIIWSATQSDPHVFHEHCMLHYLLSVGSKAARSRRRNQEADGQDPVKDATDFAMMCPCCRQSFISKSVIAIPPSCVDDLDKRAEIPGGILSDGDGASAAERAV